MLCWQRGSTGVAFIAYTQLFFDCQEPSLFEFSTAFVAGRLEWLPNRVRRYRNISSASHPSFCRLGPASVLFIVHSAAARDSDALAGYCRSGGARGTDPLAGLPGAASPHFASRFRRRNGHVGGNNMAAVDGERIDAGCVHPTAGACSLSSDMDTRVPVAARACGSDRTCGVHDRQPAVKFAISMRAAGSAGASSPPARITIFCLPSSPVRLLHHWAKLGSKART